MKFKRLAALATALVLSVTMLAACGQKPIDDTPEDPFATIDPTETIAPLVTDPPATTPIETVTTPTEPITLPTTEAPVTTTEPTTAATTEAPKTEKTDKNDYTVESISPTTMYATMSLNVRKGPSTDFGKIGALAEGEGVEVTGRASTGWYQVNYKGSTGYVSNVYMTSEQPSGSKNPSKPSSGDGDSETIDEGGDSGSEDIDEGGSKPSGGNTAPTAGTVTTGSWVKDNGVEYMYSLFTQDRYKQALNKLGEAVQNLRDTVDLGDYLSSSECKDIASNIAQVVGTEYCYFDQVYSVSGTTLLLKYYVSSASEAQSMMSALDKKVGKITSTVSGYSDYNKIKYCYEWIAKNSTYGHGSYHASAYGPIVDGKGTCMGYAKAGFLLLAKAGFDCVYCVGESDGTGDTHIWVKTKVDGKWVNIDFGWADPSGILTDGDSSYVDYAYLCVNDSYIRETRASVFDLSQYYSMPSATTESYDWFRRNGYYIESSSEMASVIKAAAKDAVNNASSSDKYIYVVLKFASNDLLEEARSEYGKKTFGPKIMDAITSKYSYDTRVKGDDANNPYQSTRKLIYRFVRN